jgi:hypothetical protein
MKRFALAGVVGLVVLACPLVSSAQLTNKYVGPAHPILYDSNANGIPDENVDGAIQLLVAGNQLTVQNPWEACGPATHNVMTLTTDPLGGPFTGGTRTTENQTESVVADRITSGRPTRFTMNVDRAGTDKSGQGLMIDQNGDGIYDGINITGDVSAQIGLLLQDVTSDGYADYVSIPWGQASALGVATGDGCGPGAGNSDPQIWVPLADTNNDNIPDSIAFDLDSNDQPDTQFLVGPIIAGPAVIGENAPTLSEWAGIGAAIALAMVAWLQIRNQGLGL